MDPDPQEIENEEPKPIQLTALISDQEKSSLFRELTTILTRRWKKDEITVFGVSEIDLLLATRMDIASLNAILEEYRGFVSLVGLKLSEYRINDEKWYCLKSEFYAPPELSKSQLIVLGTFIALVEQKPHSITTTIIKEKLVSTGLMKEYLVDTSLRSLTKKGYILRIKNYWDYNYRTHLEFDNVERTNIIEEFGKL